MHWKKHEQRRRWRRSGRYARVTVYEYFGLGQHVDGLWLVTNQGHHERIA